MKKIYSICMTEEVHDLAMELADYEGFSFSTFLSYLVLKRKKELKK